MARRALAPGKLWLATLVTVLVPSAVFGQAGVQPAITVAALSADGPYEVRTYTDFPDAPEFGDATIYYPANATGPVGGVAIAPGFTEMQRHIAWWGPRLASHGFAVLILDTNDPRERPEARAEALMAGVRTLRGENGRAGSPLQGRVDVNRMAIMGHSMGGGGVLLAANQHSAELKAAIPFTPWQPDGNFDRITVPTLVMAGSADNVAAVAAHSWPHFESIPASTPKVYMEIAGGDHFIADSTRGTDLATIGRYGIAWLKLYVDGDERYRPFIYGDYQRGDSDKFSRYVIGR
jgi:dienelactone hydrolase